MALRAAQRSALRRTQRPRMIDQCAALALPERARRRRPTGRCPNCACRRPKSMAGANGWACATSRPRSRSRPALSGRRSAGRPQSYAEVARRLTAQASRSGWSAAPAKSARSRDRRDAGPHARDLTGTDLRNAILALAASERRGLERFRAAACRGRARHALDRHLRPDQPVALGAAQSDRRGGADRDATRLPALPQADLPQRPSPLHARHRGRAGSGGHAARAGAKPCPA